MSTEYTYQVSDSSDNTLTSSYDKSTDQLMLQIHSGAGSPVTILLTRLNLQDLQRFLNLVSSFPPLTPPTFIR